MTEGPDLKLTKGDAGFVATDGQQTPFPYTITVTNIGEGEVNTADAVSVVDDLPDAFEWVAPAPAGCTINGQQLPPRLPPPGCALWERRSRSWRQHSWRPAGRPVRTRTGPTSPRRTTR